MPNKLTTAFPPEVYAGLVEKLSVFDKDTLAKSLIEMAEMATGAMYESEKHDDLPPPHALCLMMILETIRDVKAMRGAPAVSLMEQAGKKEQEPTAAQQSQAEAIMQDVLKRCAGGAA